jgi:hypothetical protein
MNAPANIAAPELSRYADTVRTFLPTCHGRELELRCRIMSARENATAAIGRGRCAPEAFGREAKSSGSRSNTHTLQHHATNSPFCSMRCACCCVRR